MIFGELRFLSDISSYHTLKTIKSDICNQSVLVLFFKLEINQRTPLRYLLKKWS